MLTPFGSWGAFGTIPPYVKRIRHPYIETILGVILVLVILHQLINELDEVLVAALQVERANELVDRLLSLLRVIVAHRPNFNRLRKTVQLACALLRRTFVLEDHLSAVVERHDRSQHRLQLRFRDMRNATSKCLISGFGKYRSHFFASSATSLKSSLATLSKVNRAAQERLRTVAFT